MLYWLNDPLTDAKSRALLQAAENVAAVRTPICPFIRRVKDRALLRRLYAAVYATFVQRFGPQYPQLQWLKVDAAANYQDILAAQIEKKMVPIIVAAVDGVGNPTLRSLSPPLPSPLASSRLLSSPLLSSPFRPATFVRMGGMLDRGYASSTLLLVGPPCRYP